MSKKDRAKIVVLAECIATESIYLLFMVLSLFLFSAEPEPPMPVSAMIIMTIHAGVLIGMSIYGFRRIRNGYRWILIPNLLMKILISWFVLGFLCIAMESDIGSDVYIAAGFIFFTGCIALGLGILIRYIFKSTSKSPVKNTQPENSEYYFESDKAKWAWNSAAREYCRLYNRNFESLSDQEKSPFYNYASSPIVYFLTWLIKNDFMSESFMQEHALNSINGIKNEMISPVEFFDAEMAYVLDSSNVSEQILPFMNWYYNRFNRPRFYSHSTKRYIFDYYEVTRNYGGIFYCADFSWEKYHQIENKINERYRYDLRLNEECGEIHGTAKWDLFNTNLEIETVKGVSDKYIESCIGQLNCLSDYVIDNLCNELIGYCDEELPEVKADKRNILNYLHPQTLIINTPKKNEPAFIVSCEYDFEQEHGIAFTMRNDILLNVGYYADAESPWSEDNETAYAIANSIRYINVYNIDSYEKISKEVEKGNLKQLSLAHMASDNANMVFVPPIVADLKYKYDIMIEYLLFEGMVNNYSCYPQYKGNSLVPSQLRIEAKKDDKFVFSETIRIW